MADNLLLTMLRRQNPKAYEQVKGMMESGTDPVQWLKEQYRSGKLTEQQLRNVQKQARLFGFRITDSEIEEIKSKPKEASMPPKKGSGWF